MLLAEVFDQLTYGELAQLSLSGKELGALPSSSYPAVVSFINLGLTELHKRFPIRLLTATIQQYASIPTYYLSTQYSTNGGSAEPIKYLLDTAGDPFENTVFKIETVRDPDNVVYTLNVVSDTAAVMTPEYNAVTMPNPVDDTLITVEYRSGHKRILLADLDPEAYELRLPRALLNPLVLFVASRAYSSRPTLEGNNESQVHLAKFEAACAKITELDLIIKQEIPNERLDNNNWA